MSARDDAVREADRVIARTGYLPIERMAAAVVDAVEPIFAAERERDWAEAYYRVRNDERERLRAQAEALCDVDRMTVEETGLGDDYWAGYDDAVADVLNLLGGESE